MSATSTSAEDAAGFARLHADAVRALEAWHAPDEHQQALRLEFLEHLRAHPDAMSKAGPPAHLTGGVIVLDETGEHALLTHHRKARRWFQFGGHYEPGDASVLAAATREAREESGLPGVTALPEIVQLDRHVLHGAFGTCREHLDIRFAAVVPAGSQARTSEESLDVRWWPVEALPEGSRDEMHPLAEAARRALAGVTRR